MIENILDALWFIALIITNVWVWHTIYCLWLYDKLLNECLEKIEEMSGGGETDFRESIIRRMK